MRITSVDTFAIDLPLSAPVTMSHVTIHKSRNVLVRVGTDEGIVGWGEGVEAMDVTGENQAGIKEAIDRFGTLLLGEDPLQVEATWERLTRLVHGNTTAIGAIDIALHDIAGQFAGQPVSALIGEAKRSLIPALTLIGTGNRDRDLERFSLLHEEGRRWFKLKVGIDEPTSEAGTLLRMAEMHGDTVICADSNGAWDEEEAALFLGPLEGSPVRFVEQPVAEFESLVRVADLSPIEICADESARTLRDVEALGRTSIAGVSLKLIKHGGITGVVRGAEICDRAGLRINLAGKIAESSISAAANLHCAAVISELAFGCSPANHVVAVEVTRSPLGIDGGHYTVPNAPGLGIEVDEDLVAALSV